MLLKSSSNPQLNSWFQHQTPTPEHDFIIRNSKSPIISFHSLISPTDSPKKISRTTSESDLIGLSISKRRNSLSCANSLLSSIAVEEDVEGEERESRGLLFSSDEDFIIRSSTSPTISFHSSNPLTDSPKKIVRATSESDLIGLCTSKRRNSLSCANSLFSSIAVEEDVEGEEREGRGLLFSSDEGCSVQVMEDGGGGGGDGGKICGGGGGNGDCDWSDGTDVYYRNMIEANPGNSLIIGNYAKYLKEVRGDFVKAEEYYSRAILANPSDGNALSMYADLIWETQKDSSRAQSYFDQAVKASPDDCYAMASYARFLWDADEEDEEEEDEGDKIAPPSFFPTVSNCCSIIGMNLNRDII